jgi:hypothetical protein
VSVAKRLREERARYLEHVGTDGGTASGFRNWVRHRATDDPTVFPIDGLRDEAATKIWESQPRHKGDDLFSIGGEDIPEFLTRPKRGEPVDGETLDDSERFEKVSAKYATVADRVDDAIIKMRVAARGSAAAERQMLQADECRRRAKGRLDVFLRDLADKKT